MAIVLNKNITDNVCGAVWLATLVMTYVEMELKQSADIYFKQIDIQKTAQKFCPKIVHSPRVSQWSNGDHPNNLYNYLRTKLKSRRLTKIGEFNNSKEYPEKLMDFEVVVFEIVQNGRKVNYGELFDWYRTRYSRISEIA